MSLTIFDMMGHRIDPIARLPKEMRGRLANRAFGTAECTGHNLTPRWCASTDARRPPNEVKDIEHVRQPDQPFKITRTLSGKVVPAQPNSANWLDELIDRLVRPW